MPRSKLRTADVAGFPIVAALSADVVVATSLIDVLTMPLPAAGSYLTELVLLVEPGTLSMSRDLTFVITATNYVSLAMVGAMLRASTNPTVYAGQSGNGQSYVVSHTSSQRSRVLLNGLLAISAPGQLTVQAFASGETVPIKAPSTMRATRNA